MPDQNDLKPLTPGPLKVDWLNSLLSCVLRFAIRVSPPLTVAQNGPVWTLGFVGGALPAALPASLPSGGIAARSGTTPGSGTITFATWDGTTYTAGTQTATAYNPFQVATPGTGIKSCWVVLWSGNYFLISWEC